MTTIKWFVPLGFAGYKKTGDVKEWGLRLDMNTEVIYYKYDWGWGFIFVILGLGFEINHVHFGR